MPPSWKTKTEELRYYVENGQTAPALRLAASFPTLGKQRVRIERGWSALQNPAFYKGMRKDPNALAATGFAAIKERFGW